MTCTGCSGAIDRVLKKTEGAVSPYLTSLIARTDGSDQ